MWKNACSYQLLRIPSFNLFSSKVCISPSPASVFSVKSSTFASETGSLDLRTSHPYSIFLFPSRKNPFYKNCLSTTVKLTTCSPCRGFLFFTRKPHFSTNPTTSTCSAEKPSSISASNIERNEAHVHFVANACSGIGKSVISRCSYIWEKKAETFAENSSLQDLLRLSGDLSPETTRRFWRVSVFKPEDFLEIILGFGPDVSVRKVDFLWKLFRWAAKQSGDFRHLPRSYEIMISMLIRVQILGDAESLLQSAEADGVFYGTTQIFSEIVQGYAKACKLESSISLYDRARDRGLVLSVSCYRALLHLLIRMEKTQSALGVYMDMIGVGLASGSDEHSLEFVIRKLCEDGKILEAVNLLRRVRGFGVEASPAALSAIAEGYHRKRDFDDLLNFLKEWKFIPKACVCNKIVSSLCMNLGTDEAWLFVQGMEVLGFELDAITSGIFICLSCREGKLKNAFIYLSETLARSIKPKNHAYNALISGLFKEGLYKHAKDVFDDMVEKGITPDISTFRVLLAGYCKYRKFDEVKLILGEMINCGMISLAPVDDALSKAFTMLGLDRVKVKRDNHIGFPKAEFFDSLGNGLYLETDLEEYEKTVAAILDDSMIPEFDPVLLEECRLGNIEAALRVKDEVVQWGQSFSLSTYSELLKALCASQSHINKGIELSDEMPELFNQLDHENLNLLIQTLSKRGLPVSARLILDKLLKRELSVESDTYTAMIMGFCEESNVHALQECWELAQRSKWLPGAKDIEALVSCLCKWGMIKEVLELFDSVVEKYPDLISAICDALLKELCVSGFTNAGCILVEEVFQRGLVLDGAAYLNLIKGFSKEQKFAEALGIFDILLENNIAPCANFYGVLVRSLCRFNRFEKAIALKQSVLSKQLHGVFFVYSTLVNELCRVGKTKEATIQLQEMQIKGIFPDSKNLNALMRGFCRENNFMKAREILCIMLRTHINLLISGYRSLVRQMCLQGQVLGALSLKEQMQRESESESMILYNILIFSLFQTGNGLVVEILLDEMIEKYIVLDQTTYNFLIHGYYKCGNVLKAVETLNTMIAEGLRPSNRNIRRVICYLCSHGKLDKALELSKVMACRGWKHGSVVQNALLGILLSYSKLREAEFFLHRMEEMDLIPKSINYDFLIKRFCVNGSIKLAVDLLNVMLKKGNLPSEISYSSVIHGLCINKVFDQALDFYAEMEHKNREPNMESCDALIYGLCLSDRTDDANRLLGIMPQFGPVPTSKMYNYVLDTYHMENNLDKASELLQEMQQKGYLPDFETHWSLISNLSSSDGKEDGTSKGFLSHLLSDSDLPSKVSKGKGASTFKHVRLQM